MIGLNLTIFITILNVNKLNIPEIIKMDKKAEPTIYGP